MDFAWHNRQVIAQLRAEFDEKPRGTREDTLRILDEAREERAAKLANPRPRR